MSDLQAGTDPRITGRAVALRHLIAGMGDESPANVCAYCGATIGKRIDCPDCGWTAAPAIAPRFGESNAHLHFGTPNASPDAFDLHSASNFDNHDGACGVLGCLSVLDIARAERVGRDIDEYGGLGVHPVPRVDGQLRRSRRWRLSVRGWHLAVGDGLARACRGLLASHSGRGGVEAVQPARVGTMDDAHDLPSAGVNK